MYRPGIEKRFDQTPVKTQWGDETIRFELGVDFDADLIVYMTTSFICKEAGIYDLRFGTEETRISRDEEWSLGIDYSIEQSKRYILQEDRPVVLESLLICVACLISSSAAKKVSMQSFYPGLPPKAMVKYEKIAKTFVQQGYVIGEDFTATNGRRYWLFKLDEQT